jgi:hypothetical protein
MKTSALLLCLGLLLPTFAIAQEAPAKRPAPTAEQREAFRQKMEAFRQKRMEAACKTEGCNCAKAFFARPDFEKPAKAPTEMTQEERAEFRKAIKAKLDARRQQIEEAKAACKCEDCFCKKGPKGPKMRGKGKGPKGPRGKGKGPRGPRPAPEAPIAE